MDKKELLKFESKNTQHDSTEEFLGERTQDRKSALGLLPWLLEAGRPDPTLQIPLLSFTLKITKETCLPLPCDFTVTLLCNMTKCQNVILGAGLLPLNAIQLSTNACGISQLERVEKDWPSCTKEKVDAWNGRKENS